MSLLFVWLIKHNGNVSDYVKFLNNRDRNDAWNKGSVSYMFRWEDASNENELLEIGTWEILSWDVVISDSGSGLDVFDPSFEQWLNEINSDSLSGSKSTGDGSFGFVGSDNWWETAVVSWDTKVQLLQQLKQ